MNIIVFYQVKNGDAFLQLDSYSVWMDFLRQGITLMVTALDGAC